MTAMQASVKNLEEIESVFAAGADLCLIEAPLAGKNQPEPSLTRPLAEKFGRERLGLMLDHKAFDAQRCETGGIGRIFVTLGPASCMESLGALPNHAPNIRFFGVFMSERGWQPDDLALLADRNFAGAMLDAADPAHAHLLKTEGIAALHDFTHACRALGLAPGIAGALETPDIARLLALDPAFLSFRGALRRGHRRQGDLDPEALALVRALIPREAGAPMEEETSKIDWRLLGRKTFDDNEMEEAETDRVFVHDLVLPMSVGAYAAEQAAAQRVRINVDLAIQRKPHHADTMRDVFSYDLIIDAVTLILARGHISVIETLAEEIAAAMLRHQRVLRARVRVEKLDVLNASVGIEINRERPERSRAGRPLRSLGEAINGINNG